ncbi:TRAP transporter small permease [Teichococcus vastitatis]|uniref:TRAP transporter small permease protein n=1 Tax=Teichococcus vastitatis TaxID=2307076 RepID=A0ABS9W9Y1_9PROT|nr:TRAP transporter small permease subunit [Pseudoroseomonas vastitatis]MCI0756112.1 TRAP transporter small permease [Pseudoroseomonas vastitatis]
MIAALRIADHGIAGLCRWGVIGGLLGLFFLLLLGVIVRFVPVLPISGYDEIVELLVIWLTMLGALALWREGALYRVTVVEAVLPTGLRRAVGFAQQLLMLAFSVVLVVWGLDFLLLAGETTPFLGADKSWWYAALPGPGMLMVAYSLVGLWRVWRGKSALAEGGSIVA